MGGLCALAFVLEYPWRVRRLVLVDTLAGGPSLQRARGMPWCWGRGDTRFWRFVWWGLRIAGGTGNLAIHKRLAHLIAVASYVDPARVPPLSIDAGDRGRPTPIRDRWPRVARRLDYRARLGDVRASTLVCAGRFDPQTPLACAEELAAGIPRAELAVFEHSGHRPFEEEQGQFTAIVNAFLSRAGG
jgi:pimeloyl-ACP methyl ester carboxylesterase